MDTPKRTINFGTKFWFWTGRSSMENNSKEWGQQITEVLRQCEAVHGKFAHKSSAHTFRHFFAITMLNAGVDIEMVTEWLGHSNSDITRQHYLHANADRHSKSHDVYRAAIAKIEGHKKPAKVVRMRKIG